MIFNSRTIARPERIRAALLLAAAVLCLPAPPAAGSVRDWPKPLGHLSDFAGAVDAASADSIEAICREVEEKTGVEISVVTLTDLGGQEIDPAATDLFQAWGIGKRGKDDGILILLSMGERRVRIETGYGIEGILPDGLCGSIIRRIMGPELASGEIGHGLLRGAQAVAGVIARDRGIELTGAIADLPGEQDSEEGPHQPLLLLIGFIVVFVLSLYFRFASLQRGWIWSGGDWRSRGRGGPGGWFGGFGGFGGGLGGGSGGGGFG
ncbi:MAG TPA: TPM domain-containing protein, partial [Planctomycetota bacterium]|nr:TPM domain-containing protein [Planctomycetota bacterium]